MVGHTIPKYPRSGVSKSIEGWVEVGFQVNAKSGAIMLHIVNITKFHVGQNEIFIN